MQSKHAHWQGAGAGAGQREGTSPEDRAKLQAWFVGQIPDGWFIAPPDVTVDNEEILVMGEISPPDLGPDATDEARREAEGARIERFREDTREQRMRVADNAQRRFRRRVSWGAKCGETRRHFTTTSVPVMTRLRMPERSVLDTLIDSGVARSRSDALAWCVRLVGRNEADWISELRSAFEHVENVRAQGPKSDRAPEPDVEDAQEDAGEA